jgi:hypothetical protein
MYRPVPGESMNCAPPRLVHASTKTTTAGGVSARAKRASIASTTVGWNARRLRHMSSCPVRPWMT